MAERQTKGFGEVTQGPTYSLAPANEAATKKPQEDVDKQIVMDIGAEESNTPRKIFLNRSAQVTTLTGNFFKDSFQRLNGWLIAHSKIKIADMASFFRLLAVMMNAGLPLIRSLDTLGAQTEKSPKLSKTLHELARSIEGGKSLSISMEQYPDVFSEAQIGAIKAGEASGQLNKTLRDLAVEVEKSAAITGKVKGAMVYPIGIMLILIGVIFLMMVMVVPQITQLFSSTGNELPLPTQILIGISDFSVAYWPVIVAAGIGFMVGFLAWKRTPNGRYLWDLLLINLPIFGNLVKKSTLSKFAHSFGNLLSSGVPIIKSIEIVAKAVGNEVYKRRFLLTAEDMKSGIPMAENLSSSKLFPTMLVNMIEIGEQTAQLESVTAKIADFYDDEVTNAVNALTKIMEPLILVIVGGVVGGLVAAIMLPIIQLTNVAGG